MKTAPEDKEFLALRTIKVYRWTGPGKSRDDRSVVDPITGRIFYAEGWKPLPKRKGRTR